MVAAAIVALTLFGFFVFPGHTYLQSDTQIYIPMLERLSDPSLYERDLITSRPHLSWTIYDETASALHVITGASFQHVLQAQQLITRALGIWGAYLIGLALGLSQRTAIVLAAVFSLGATIVGPSVLTFEYEPVPRGFSIMLVVLAIGFAMLRRYDAAAIAGAVAILYHAPTSAPFWLVFGLTLLCDSAVGQTIVFRRLPYRRWLPLLIGVAAVALLVIFSRLQPGVVEPQPVFQRITPELEAIQRMRASYNWVSLWPPAVYWHYLVSCAVIGLALRRLRVRSIYTIALPIIGLLSIPASYIFLEQMKWSLIPQFQPARMALFITLFAILLATAAALRSKRLVESIVWLLIPLAIVVNRVVVPPYSTVGLDTYPKIWTPELRELSSWARTNTPKNAMFLFPDAGRQLYPGIFRAESLRAVYVDWKAGGQANYFPDLAKEWLARWQDVMNRPPDWPRLASLGVNYVVLRAPDVTRQPAYRNASYYVYLTSAPAP